MTKPNWKPQKIKLGQIQAWDSNPRMSTKAQAQRIIASERKFGQPVPFLVAPEVDGRFLLYDGHQRLAAWFTVYGADYQMDAMVSDRPLTEAEHKELIITLHTGATGSWDWNALSGWSAGDLQEWGMNGDALKSWNNDANNLKELLTAEVEPVDAEPQTDRAGELAEKWQTASGQLWKLGDHRLLIGDCTVRENVERLMGGERADMVFTDPPYGMNLDTSNSNNVGKKDGWTSKAKNYEAVIGDGEDFSDKLINTIFDNFEYCKEIFIWGADYFAELIPNRKKGSWIVWDKRASVENMKLTFSEFELCWSKEKHLREIARITWSGLLGTEQEFDHKRSHPTQKPTLLGEWFLSRFSKENSVIVDLYAGAGFSIIAAHNLNRRCYAMEISEKYGAVILQRFLDATGIQPELLL